MQMPLREQQVSPKLVLVNFPLVSSSENITNPAIISEFSNVAVPVVGNPTPTSDGVDSGVIPVGNKGPILGSANVAPMYRQLASHFPQLWTYGM